MVPAVPLGICLLGRRELRVQSNSFDGPRSGRGQHIKAKQGTACRRGQVHGRRHVRHPVVAATGWFGLSAEFLALLATIQGTLLGCLAKRRGTTPSLAAHRWSPSEQVFPGSKQIIAILGIPCLGYWEPHGQGIGTTLTLNSLTLAAWILHAYQRALGLP